MKEINQTIKFKTNDFENILNLNFNYIVQISYTFNLEVKSGLFSGNSSFCVRNDEIKKMIFDLREMYDTLKGNTILYDNDSDSYLKFEMLKNGHLSIKGQVGGSHQDHSMNFLFLTDQTGLLDFIEELNCILKIEDEK